MGVTPSRKVRGSYPRENFIFKIVHFGAFLMAFSCFALGAQWRSQKFVNGQEFGCDQSDAQRPPDVRRREAP